VSDLLQGLQSLPNIHPAVIHFPVALIPMAVVCDLVAMLLRRRQWIDRMASTLYALGGLGALVAYVSGEQASDSVVLTTAVEVLPKIALHSHWAGYTVWIFTTLAVVRLIWAWWRRHDANIRYLAVRIIFWLVGVGGLLVLVRTADLGGRLVFWYHVGSPAGEAEQ